MHRRRAAVDQLLSRFGQLFRLKQCLALFPRPFFAVFPLPLGQIFKIEEIRPAAFQKAAFGIKNCRCRIYLSLVWAGKKAASLTDYETGAVEGTGSSSRIHSLPEKTFFQVFIFGGTGPFPTGTQSSAGQWWMQNRHNRPDTLMRHTRR